MNIIHPSLWTDGFIKTNLKDNTDIAAEELPLSIDDTEWKDSEYEHYTLPKEKKQKTENKDN